MSFRYFFFRRINSVCELKLKWKKQNLRISFERSRVMIWNVFRLIELYLDKATSVADRLLPSFDTPTGICRSLIVLSTWVRLFVVDSTDDKKIWFSGASKNWNWAAGGCSILSEIGTIHLEFQYLSQLTGNNTYLQKVFEKFVLNSMKKIFFVQVEKLRQSLKDASENNMFYNYINPQTGKWCQSEFERIVKLSTF